MKYSIVISLTVFALFFTVIIESALLVDHKSTTGLVSGINEKNREIILSQSIGKEKGFFGLFAIPCK